MECGERGVQEDSRVWRLNKWKESVATNKMVEAASETGLGEIKCSILEVFRKYRARAEQALWYTFDNPIWSYCQP